MREIKFRGYDYRGMWVYGDLNTKPIHYACCILENGVINHSVDPASVGQFTGLLDKNGKKIYEGDVIEYAFWNKSGKASVKFEYGSFGLSEYDTFFEFDTFKAFTYWDEPDINCFPFIEIIGNVYENPSLLHQQGE